jgi:hypothetical protein
LCVCTIRPESVTYVPGLICYPCRRLIPRVGRRRAESASPRGGRIARMRSREPRDTATRGWFALLRRIAWTGALLLLVAGLSFAPTICGRYDRSQDVEGVVVARDPMVMDSRSGGGIGYFLWIQTASGAKVRVHVHEDTFRRALVGMRCVKRRGAAPILSPPPSRR